VTVLQAKLGGVMKVAMWLCTLLLVGPNYVVLVISNEGWVPHHMQGHHTWDLWIGLRKLVVLTLNIHQIFSEG
jgi:hypothetical protein